MTGRRRKPKEVKRSESGVFCEGDIAATSSPKSSTAVAEVSREELHAFLDQQCEEEKEELVRTNNNVKDKIRSQVTLFLMKFSPQTLDAVFDNFEMEDEEITMDVEKTEKKTEKETLKRIDTRKCDETNSTEKETLKRIDTRKCDETNSTACSSMSHPDSKCNTVSTGTDSEGFKIPKILTKGSCHSSVASTPMGKRHQRNIALVTPGPNIHNPISVMRRPAPGETAISLDGSPLLVSTDVLATAMPNITVPVDDQVISIFPREGFVADDMPQLDDRTRAQLNRLREYLDAIVSRQ